MPRMRLWDSLLLTYCRQRPCDQHRGLLVFTGFAGKQRADERTRTAYSCSLRVIIHVLQGLAEVCKPRISKPVSFLRFAVCCPVLRSRWYQSGINRGKALSQSCSRTHPQHAQPPTDPLAKPYVRSLLSV